MPSRAQISELLDLLPDYFSQAVVDRDEGGDGGTALIGFGIRVMPFDEQKELIDDIRAQLDPPGSDLDPPPGVDVRGGRAAGAGRRRERRAGQQPLPAHGAGLLVIALVLLAVYRSAARALVP